MAILPSVADGFGGWSTVGGFLPAARRQAAPILPQLLGSIGSILGTESALPLLGAAWLFLANRPRPRANNVDLR